MNTPTLTQRNPAIVVGLVSTAVASVLALLVAFGVNLNQGQQVAVLGIIAGIGPLIAAVFTRGQVSPTATVVAQVVDGVVVAGPALTGVDDGLPVEVVPAT